MNETHWLEAAIAEMRRLPNTKDRGRALKHRLVDAQSRIVEELTEVMRTMQTELLRGFAAFAEGMNIRLTKVEKSQTLLDESTSGRLRIIEERMRQIEQRLSLQ